MNDKAAQTAMVEDGEVRSCPCCGGEAGRCVCNVLHDDSLYTHNLYMVICHDCGVQTKPYDTFAEAVAVWNSRTKTSGDENHQLVTCRLNPSNSTSLHSWVPCCERLPTEEDADHHGQIIAYSADIGQSTVCVWHHIIGDGATTHWMPLPKPPEDRA